MKSNLYLSFSPGMKRRYEFAWARYQRCDFENLEQISFARNTRDYDVFYAAIIRAISRVEMFVLATLEGNRKIL